MKLNKSEIDMWYQYKYNVNYLFVICVTVYLYCIFMSYLLHCGYLYMYMEIYKMYICKQKMLNI